MAGRAVLDEQPESAPGVLGRPVARCGIDVALVEGLDRQRYQLIRPFVVCVSGVNPAPDQVEGRRGYGLLAMGEGLPRVDDGTVKIARRDDAVTRESA